MIHNEDRFIVDTMVWSYSRLSAFHQCPYGFYLKYIQCNEGDNNFFGQYGSFVHKILEMYTKGELTVLDISQYYEENFDKEITFNAPKNQYTDIRQSYYEKGMDYLNNIDLLLDKYEVLGIEQEVQFAIGGYEMIGYIDLLLKDKKTGDISVVDHKTATIKFKKNGEISKTNLKDVEAFKKQLYLYSMWVIKKYKKKPKYLQWNLFKDRNWLTVDFDEKEYQNALKWAEDTVKEIEQEETWFPNPSQYFCWNICDMRNCACEYKPA